MVSAGGVEASRVTPADFNYDSNLSFFLIFPFSHVLGSEMQEPYAIAVLLQNDLVLIDLLTPGFPCFESPYPMDIHESPVTCCTYLADCPSDLVPAFYMVGLNPNARKAGQSERQWPVSGGEWSPASCSYFEIIITGHQDGSIKFWDSSAGTLQVLYKLKTAKIFERPRARSLDGSDDDPLAVQIISLCAESRRLCIAGASGHVILFKFRKVESVSEYLVSVAVHPFTRLLTMTSSRNRSLQVLEIPIFYENFDEAEGSPECEFVPRSLAKQPESVDGDRKVSTRYACKLSTSQKNVPTLSSNENCCCHRVHQIS